VKKTNLEPSVEINKTTLIIAHLSKGNWPPAGTVVQQWQTPLNTVDYWQIVSNSNSICGDSMKSLAFNLARQTETMAVSWFSRIIHGAIRIN